MRLGLTYAAGHALVLLALGGGAVLIGLRLPEGWDVWREKIVGATLVALGFSVVAAMIAHRRKQGNVEGGEEAHPVSRAALMLNAFRRVAHWFRSRYIGGDAIPQLRSGNTPAFLMGVLHGLGAETPSQLLLLVVAAGMGSTWGLAAVCSFVAGLFITNTILCAVMVGLYQRQFARRAFVFTVSGASAAYSVTIGLLYLAGVSFP